MYVGKMKKEVFSTNENGYEKYKNSSLVSFACGPMIYVFICRREYVIEMAL